MRIETFFPPQHGLHAPPFEVYEGEKQPYLESPDRVTIILDAIRASGLVDVFAAEQQPEALLERVHSPDYVRFLKNASGTTDKWMVPSLFPISDVLPENPGALLGYYSFETSTAVGRGTYDAAKNSADAAITGALELIGGQQTVYSLCRPPGHHAERKKMGGYCYFNNAALAASQLSDYGKVAILDLDAHHFNGTQGIFYKKSDVFTVSIHGDPTTCYPYFTGYSNETGAGEGLGYNLNLPVNPLLMDNSAYDAVLRTALLAIKQFSPKYLVLSMGFDTYKNDPGAEFKLTSDYYQQIGDRIRSLYCPTLIVQEGGYDLESIGNNAVSLLRGFKQNKIFAVTSR